MKKNWKTILGDWDTDIWCEKCDSPASLFAPLDGGPYDPEYEKAFCEPCTHDTTLHCIPIGERGYYDGME